MRQVWWHECHSFNDGNAIRAVTLDDDANATAISRLMARNSTLTSRSFDVSDVVSELESAPARGHARKSRLYLWLQQNHDALTQEFTRNPPSWNKLADILGRRGVLDGDGKNPTARGARGAWYRVRRDIAAARARATAKLENSTHGIRPIAQEPLAVLLTSTPVSIHLDEGEAERPRFKLASLRGATAADGPQPPTPAALPAASKLPAENPQKFDDVMAEFLGTPARRPKGDE